jgi:broad specificity phosphatase PhoE
LERARRTAEAFSDDVVIDDAFIEIDLGRWDGLSSDEVLETDGERLKQSVADRIMPMGETGESLTEAGERILSAVERLVDTMPDDSSAAVVTHGGLLQTVLHNFLPGGDRRVHTFVDNTSLTRIKVHGGRHRLASFNDTGHIGPRSLQVQEFLEAGHPVLALVRHGETRANVERRWQGHSDWDLNELGYRQAEALGLHYGTWDTVFSSPLKRARQTAEYVTNAVPIFMDDLREMNMGIWEGMTTDEIEAQWPELIERIYTHGEDVKRGETGETWAELTTRFRGAVDGVTPATGEPTVIVAHGGAIRSYISSLTTTTDSYSESLYTPRNTGVSHVAVTDKGPMIIDYAVAFHLEGMDV